MKPKENIVRIYTGTEVSSILLKALLEESGIPSIIKNDASSAFMGAVPAVVDLYIEEKDIGKAKPLLIEFRRKIQK